MAITVETTTSLLPELPLGKHSVAVDGPGSIFVAWKDGDDFRVQLHDRTQAVKVPFFTAFTDATAIGDFVYICPFVSGGIALVYPQTGGTIAYEFIDQDGVYVGGAAGSFVAAYDAAFPQIVCATNANDVLSICFINTSDNVICQLVTDIPASSPVELAPFQVNATTAAPQLVTGEFSLFSVTSNWSGGRFAAMYMAGVSGHGLIRKFDETGTLLGSELDILEGLRECPLGGANRGNPCLMMNESNERLFLVNPIVPVGPTTPPTKIRTRLYNETLTGTVFSSIHTNPSSTTFKLNVLGCASYASGNGAFVIDDADTNLNVFYLDAAGTIINTIADLDGIPMYKTGISMIPSGAGFGDMFLVAFHDDSAGAPPGTSYLVGLNADQEVHIRGYATEDVDLIRVPVYDDESVTELTNINVTIVGPGARSTSSLDSFIGGKDIALLGGPQTNTNTADFFNASGAFAADIADELTRNGVSSLQFTNLVPDGDGLDDRDGVSLNAPRIEVVVPYNAFSATTNFVCARHQIGPTIYDYAVAVKVEATKRLYMLAGIRDISTRALAGEIFSGDPDFDNPLENMSALLCIVTYPATVTSVADFETEQGLGNVDIYFRPLVGIRENSPLK